VKRPEPGGPTPRSGLCSATLGTVTLLAAAGLICSGLGLCLTAVGTITTWRTWDLGSDPASRAAHGVRVVLVFLHLLPRRHVSVSVQGRATLPGVGAMTAGSEQGLTGRPAEDVLLLETRLNRTRADLAALRAESQGADAALRGDLDRLEGTVRHHADALEAGIKRVATDGLGMQLVGSLLVLVGVLLTAWGSV
jgi:hypothetical protein